MTFNLFGCYCLKPTSKKAVNDILEKAREVCVPIAAPGKKGGAKGGSKSAGAAQAAKSAAAAAAAAASAADISKEPTKKSAAKKDDKPTESKPKKVSQFFVHFWKPHVPFKSIYHASHFLLYKKSLIINSKSITSLTKWYHF